MEAGRIKLFIKSFNNIKSLVAITVYSCLIYLHNSLLILNLKVTVSQYKRQLGTVVSYSKLGFSLSNISLKAFLLKILSNCKIRTKYSCVEGKLQISKTTRLGI